MHEMQIKVRGYHLDLYGHVNNARFLEFLEEGRWCLLEQSLNLKKWQSQGLNFFVVNININYRQPAFLDDILRIQTNMSRFGNKSGIIHQKIFLKETEKIIVDADITFVIADSQTGKALPIKGKIKSALEILTA